MVVLRLSPSWHAEQGQNLVEFALSLVILLVITFGFIDFARLAFVASVLQAAAEEGARAGIIHNTTDAQIQAAARNRMVGLDPAETGVAVTHPDGNSVEVAVTYDYVFMAPIVGALVAGGQVPLTSRARMIIH